MDTLRRRHKCQGERRSRGRGGPCSTRERESRVSTLPSPWAAQCPGRTQALLWQDGEHTGTTAPTAQEQGGLGCTCVDLGLTEQGPGEQESGGTWCNQQEATQGPRGLAVTEPEGCPAPQRGLARTHAHATGKHLRHSGFLTSTHPESRSHYFILQEFPQLRFLLSSLGQLSQNEGGREGGRVLPGRYRQCGRHLRPGGDQREALGTGSLGPSMCTLPRVVATDHIC